MFITGRSVPDYAPFDEAITAMRCDHRDDEQAIAVFDRIVHDAGAIDVLVNNVWGSYERRRRNTLVTSRTACRSRPRTK